MSGGATICGATKMHVSVRLPSRPMFCSTPRFATLSTSRSVLPRGELGEATRILLCVARTCSRDRRASLCRFSGFWCPAECLEAGGPALPRHPGPLSRGESCAVLFFPLKKARGLARPGAAPACFLGTYKTFPGSCLGSKKGPTHIGKSSFSKPSVTPGSPLNYGSVHQDCHITAPAVRIGGSCREPAELLKLQRRL